MHVPISQRSRRRGHTVTSSPTGGRLQPARRSPRIAPSARRRTTRRSCRRRRCCSPGSSAQGPTPGSRTSRRRCRCSAWRQACTSVADAARSAGAEQRGTPQPRQLAHGSRSVQRHRRGGGRCSGLRVDRGLLSREAFLAHAHLVLARVEALKRYWPEALLRTLCTTLPRSSTRSTSAFAGPEPSRERSSLPCTSAYRALCASGVSCTNTSVSVCFVCPSSRGTSGAPRSGPSRTACRPSPCRRRRRPSRRASSPASTCTRRRWLPCPRPAAPRASPALRRFGRDVAQRHLRAFVREA